MKSWFKPSVALMHHLRYSQKFTLIGILLLLPAIVAMSQYFESLHEQKTFNRNERMGVEYIRAVKPFMADMQRHRALASGYLSGNTDSRSKLLDKEAEMKVQVESVNAIEEKYGRKLNTTAQWNKIKGTWVELEEQVMTIQASESIARHSALVADMINFISEIADASNLTLDPELDTYYLMDSIVNRLPVLSEKMGQSRAHGMVVTETRIMTEEKNLALNILYGHIADNSKANDAGMQKIWSKSPYLKAELEKDILRTSEAIRTFIEKLDKEVIHAAEITMSSDEFYTLSTSAIDEVWRAFDLEIQKLDELLEARIERISQTTTILLLLTVLMLIVVCYLFAGFYISVKEMVTELQRVTRSLAEGDMTVKIHLKTKDEMKLVIEAFEHMTGGLNIFFGKVFESAQTLAASSQQISASTEEVNCVSLVQTNSMQTLNEMFKDLSAVILSVSRSAGHAADLSDQSRKESELGGEVVQSSIDAMRQLNAKMSVLQQDSDQIGEILEVIDDIADQTNLLALNAAIEAARAGDQGRGFAVVANEVRNLAERSREATKQISIIIKAIQDNTLQSAAAVNQASELSLKTGEAFRQIREKVDEVSEKIVEIASASNSQSEQTAKVLTSIESIAAASEESAAACDEMARSSQAQVQLAEELNRTVSVFKTR